MDTGILLGIICFVAAVLLILIGVPIGFALGMAATASFYIFSGNPKLIPLVAFDRVNNFILTAVPLFVLMGEILVHSGLSKGIYRGAASWLAWAPGGLLHANIGSCAFFAAISGSSPATAATIGTVAIPELEKRGYDTRLTLGSLAAGGTLGILIPPSVNLIFYGWLAEVSVARLFAGGILPGIMLSGMFMLYIAIRVIRNRTLAPREAFSRRGLLLSFLDLWPLVVIMSIVLGGVFGGVVTPTEAAALGVTSALIIGFGLRLLTWQRLRDSLFATVAICSMILVVTVGASILASFLAIVGLPRTLAALVIGSGLSKWAILLMVYLLYLFLGCFMDGISAMLMTLPAILPIITGLGFDVIWFGVILVLFTEIGLLTPPVGVNVFVIKAISGKSLGDVFKGSAPFFLIMLVAVAVVTAFPSIITWLPKVIMG